MPLITFFIVLLVPSLFGVVIVVVVVRVLFVSPDSDSSDFRLVSAAVAAAAATAAIEVMIGSTMRGGGCAGNVRSPAFWNTGINSWFE